MLDTQYRMHPAISAFPRAIFYDGRLQDGPNVRGNDYGRPLRDHVLRRFPAFRPFTILDLASNEERGGTSLMNSAEAELALHLYRNLTEAPEGKAAGKVAVITPYTQQKNLLQRTFEKALGIEHCRNAVEVNTVDSFQGREAAIVIFSCVRAAGSHGIGFLSDVRRMNVALTRAKYFMFVIAHCKSISVNPYWKQLVDNSAAADAVLKIPPIVGSKPNFAQLAPNIPNMNLNTNQNYAHTYHQQRSHYGPSSRPLLPPSFPKNQRGYPRNREEDGEIT
uniref:DNA2/NAM7 helicase-like C-terminal domain-containing protein n=2 Tax=Corethron hystrix TaxID=216773 RepID=A0A7S1FUF0_9STRA|mmetsp:Transcript_30112/g.69028  ORF Transcript_30112/g.69028 Transcript_30112/m.69028 type:complete len:278 (+) Transcript_30112:603-1436(+)